MGQAEDARASAFTVTPVRILLGQRANSALLTVRNDSTEPLRFQISLKAWNQAPDGEMQLSNTTDLVFFPSMMELKAGEEKKVRVGSAFKTPVITEKTYRIFFEELPPANVARTDNEGAQVRVLTRMGVPIFVQPSNPVIKGEVGVATLSGGKLSFDVRNLGNTFFTVTGATITGVGKNGATTFQKKQDGWYVLAGGHRRFEFEVPREACSATDRIKIEVGSSIADEKGSLSVLTRDMTVAGNCDGVKTASR